MLSVPDRSILRTYATFIYFFTHSILLRLLSPEYTTQSVKAVDDQGASIAKRKARVLAAAVGEAFYAVSSNCCKQS